MFAYKEGQTWVLTLKNKLMFFFFFPEQILFCFYFKVQCLIFSYFVQLKKIFLFMQLQINWFVISGEWSLDQISLDIFSWSKVSLKFGIWLKLFFVSWSNFTWSFQLIKSFINVILSYFKLSINCQKITCKFWQLIETFKLIELLLMANFNPIS